MRNSITLTILLIMMTGSAAHGVSLAKKWETGHVFKTPESVIYDAERHILYVSNINGGPTEKDGNGFISRVSMDGEVRKLKWIKGLNAPKGMGVYKGKLYVADIDEIVEIDIRTDKIVKRHKVENCQFLNDITIDDEGNVYVSDSARHYDAIYRLRGGVVERWLIDRDIRRPNGLWYMDGILYVGISGDAMIRNVDIATKEITDGHVVGSSIDGIARDSRGNFFVSNWHGKTVYVDRGGGIRVLIDTTEEKVNAADIFYIEKYKMLLIPTFHDNRIIACTLRL